MVQELPKYDEGEALPKRRRRYVRADSPEHPLTPLKLEALRLIAESQYLATPQVAQLMGASERAVRAHLRDLLDMGLLEPIPVPRSALKMGEADPMTLTFGSAPKIHRPTKLGISILIQSRQLDPEFVMKPAAYGPENAAFLAHELAVRDVGVWLARSARSDPSHIVERWECSASLAVGPTRPDATFTYRFGSKVVAGFVEVDMGTERGQNRWWSKKFSAYESVFSEESKQLLKNILGYSRARLVVTVPTLARAEWIARTAQSEGGVVARQCWVAVRETLSTADIYSPVWHRPDGSRSGFLPRHENDRREIELCNVSNPNSDQLFEGL